MDLKIIPVVQVIIAAVLMGILAKTLPAFSYNFSAKISVVVLLMVVAVFIGIMAIVSFKSHNTTVNPTSPEKASLVVNTGVFAYSRNPMYLALLLVLFALAVYLSNAATFAVIPFFIAYITQFQIKPEERALTSLFGQNYSDYRTKVRRWF